MSRHWMPLYIGDYRVDTMHLDQAQHGAYLLLLMHCWKTQEPLPKNLDACYRIASALTEDEQRNVKQVLKQFFECTKDGYENLKIREVIEEQSRKTQSARENGSKGGRPKKTQKKAKQNPEQKLNETLPITQTETQTKAKQKLPEPEPKPDIHNGDRYAMVGSPSQDSARGKKERNHRLPEDWQLDQALLDWAHEKHPEVDTGLETEKFKNHFLGNGKPQADWRRVWQNWIIRSKEFSKGKAPAMKTGTVIGGNQIKPAHERIAGEGTL